MVFCSLSRGLVFLYYIIEAMFTALCDDDSKVGRAAGRVLGQLGKRQTHILERILNTHSNRLLDMHWQTQLSVVEAFAGLSAKQGQQAVIDILLSCLSDGVPLHVQRVAIRALERVGKGKALVVESLLSTFSDTYGFVRSEVARVLGSLGKNYPQVIDALFKALSDDNGEVIYSAAMALVTLGEEQARITEALMQALFSSSSHLRDGVYRALGQLGKGQPQVIETLLPALSSPDHEIRVVAAQTLGQLDEKLPDVINTLLPLLSDSSWLVRSKAVEALGELYGKQTDIVESLIPTLTDPSSTVRVAAARAFKNIIRENEDNRIITALHQATYDSDRRVRVAAASALANAQSDIALIGTRIEELVRQSEYEEGSYSLLFNALRDISEKTDIG